MYKINIRSVFICHSQHKRWTLDKMTAQGCNYLAALTALKGNPCIYIETHKLSHIWIFVYNYILNCVLF